MAIIDDRLSRRNSIVLAVAQALGGAGTSITISIGGLVGVYLLNGTTPLATMPVTTMVVGTACGTIPAAFLLSKLGRRPGSMVGALISGLGGLIAFSAIMMGSFALFCLGTFLGGLSFAFVQQYRFAAAENASPKFRPQAISIVLAGGIFAGIIGPQTVIATQDRFIDVPYASGYLAQAMLCLVVILVLVFYRPAPPPPVEATTEKGRPLHVIFREPKVAIAVLIAVISYAMMSLVMTAAPLAMIACGFGTADAALGIQWHVIAMFGPSFFTGRLIQRYGAEPIAGIGLCLLVLAGVTALLGITIAHFYIALIFLGLGWNFGFIGGTTMLTNAQRPEERAKVQAANDFIVFVSVAIASLSSGALFSLVGWAAINWALIPLVVIVFALLIASQVGRPQPGASAA
ncbi:MAG: MFS transporter [Pseudomonadota bacterium]